MAASGSCSIWPTESQHEMGYEVDLVLAKPSSSPRMAEVSSDVNVCVLNARRLSSSLPVVVRYLRKNRPDVLISALVSANIVAAWAKRLTRTKTRVIVSEHNVLSEQVRMKRDHNWKARVAPFFVSTAYGAADGIVAVSDGVADDLATYAGISRDDIEVLPNPVITPDLLRRAEEPVDHRWFRRSCGSCSRRRGTLDRSERLSDAAAGASAGATRADRAPRHPRRGR